MKLCHHRWKPQPTSTYLWRKRPSPGCQRGKASKTRALSIGQDPSHPRIPPPGVEMQLPLIQLNSTSEPSKATTYFPPKWNSQQRLICQCRSCVLCYLSYPYFQTLPYEMLPEERLKCCKLLSNLLAQQLGLLERDQRRMALYIAGRNEDMGNYTPIS